MEDQAVIIGERLRELREERKLSQGDIERRTGLLRCYVSRVEHGHTVPAVETLEKFARALEIPMYQLFYEGTAPSVPSAIRQQSAKESVLWGSSKKDAASLKAFRECFSRM